MLSFKLRALPCPAGPVLAAVRAFPCPAGTVLVAVRPALQWLNTEPSMCGLRKSTGNMDRTWVLTITSAFHGPCAAVDGATLHRLGSDSGEGHNAR